MYGQPQNELNNHLKDYVEVNVRIQRFYEKYPEGSIQTEILKWEDGVVVMKALAYRTSDDIRPATGHAYEKEGSSQVNRTSALENCETSAVGRALALLGFEIKKSVASKEEVENAIHQQNKGENLQSKRDTTNNATKEQRAKICATVKKLALQKPEFVEILSNLSITDYNTMSRDAANQLMSALATYQPKGVALHVQ